MHASEQIGIALTPNGHLEPREGLNATVAFPHRILFSFAAIHCSRLSLCYRVSCSQTPRLTLLSLGTAATLYKYPPL